MKNDTAIEVNNLSKTFKLPHENYSGVKQAFINVFNINRGYEEQRVLNDVSFEIKKGEFFGIVGRNGSGKSTLLKILAGIYTPNSGAVNVNGSLTPFIELGVGFNPELTGKENIFMNGALLGFSRKEMEAMYEDIVSFAELENFMDQKLKNYSSGMQVRLAFSIAIRAKSDILLIDEVLAVGDAAFQQKCFNYFNDLKRNKKTVVFVSHDRGALEKFCNKGILIEEGKVITKGGIKDVLKKYSQVVLGEINPEGKVEAQNSTKPTYAEIYDTITIDTAGKPRQRFNYGERIVVTYKIRIKKPLRNSIAGITIWEKGTERSLLAANSQTDSVKELENLVPGDNVTVSMEIDLNLNDGEYIVESAIANETASIFYDQAVNAARFIVSGSRNPHSLVSPNKRIKIEVNND